MTNKNLYLKNSFPKNILNQKTFKNFSKNYISIIKKIKIDIENERQTLNILSSNFKFNFNLTDLKKFRKYKTVVCIGMGGSILGPESLYYFFRKKIKKNFYFLNNIDQQKLLEIKKKINIKKSLFIVTSKSGNTIETIFNFLLFKITKKNLIFRSEKKDNFLNNLAKIKKIFFLEHNSSIGGRYSVLSEVGLIPAYLMGINIYQLRKNSQKYLTKKGNILLRDHTIKLATFLKSKKYTNLVFLNYSSKLEKFLYWLQQLIAESLGKKNLGFLPMISNVPKDHHSLLQLYLDGPNDKIFFIFDLAEKKSNIKIKFNNPKSKIGFLNNKTLEEIKISQKNALIKVLKNKRIPYREIKIKKDTVEALGELFAYFILETIIIGKLNKLNPFDQPAVERVKNLTKKLLS